MASRVFGLYRCMDVFDPPASFKGPEREGDTASEE